MANRQGKDVRKDRKRWEKEQERAGIAMAEAESAKKKAEAIKALQQSVGDAIGDEEKKSDKKEQS